MSDLRQDRSAQSWDCDTVRGVLARHELPRLVQGLDSQLPDRNAVVQSLERLSIVPSALQEVRTEWTKRFGESLEQTLRTRFGSPACDHAIKLIEAGSPSGVHLRNIDFPVEPASKAARLEPKSLEDYLRSARRSVLR